MKANRQWGRVGWMLADHRDRLKSSSFCLILDSSVGLSVGDSVPETLVRILHSAEEDRLSSFDSIIACLCQSINDNKYVSKIKSILSNIFYTIYRTGCFHFIHFPFDDGDNMFSSSYYRQNQIGNMISLCLGLGHAKMLCIISMV